jgi:hypothetical protein
LSDKGSLINHFTLTLVSTTSLLTGCDPHE